MRTQSASTSLPKGKRIHNDDHLICKTVPSKIIALSTVGCGRTYIYTYIAYMEPTTRQKCWCRNCLITGHYVRLITSCCSYSRYHVYSDIGVEIQFYIWSLLIYEPATWEKYLMPCLNKYLLLFHQFQLKELYHTSQFRGQDLLYIAFL